MGKRKRTYDEQIAEIRSKQVAEQLYNDARVCEKEMHKAITDRDFAKAREWAEAIVTSIGKVSTPAAEPKAEAAP